MHAAVDSEQHSAKESRLALQPEAIERARGHDTHARALSASAIIAFGVSVAAFIGGGLYAAAMTWPHARTYVVGLAAVAAIPITAGAVRLLRTWHRELG